MTKAKDLYPVTKVYDHKAALYSDHRTELLRINGTKLRGDDLSEEEKMERAEEIAQICMEGHTAVSRYITNLRSADLIKIRHVLHGKSMFEASCFI